MSVYETYPNVLPPSLYPGDDTIYQIANALGLPGNPAAGSAFALIAELAAGSEGLETITSPTSGSAVIDVTSPTVFPISVITLHGATPELYMPAPTAKGQKKRLYLIQDATGGRVPTWAGATVNWLNGQPILQLAASAVDQLDFTSIDGSTWEGTCQTSIAAPSFGTQTIVSGTVYQNATNSWQTVYIQVIGGSSGTVKVDIGPSNSVGDNLFPATASNAVNDMLIPVRVPPGFYWRVTATTATIQASSVVVTE